MLYYKRFEHDLHRKYDDGRADRCYDKNLERMRETSGNNTLAEASLKAYHGQLKAAENDYYQAMDEFVPGLRTLYIVKLLISNNRNEHVPETAICDDYDVHWSNMSALLDDLYNILPTSQFERQVQFVVEAQKHWAALNETEDLISNISQLFDLINQGHPGHIQTEKLEDELKEIQ